MHSQNFVVSGLLVYVIHKYAYRWLGLIGQFRPKKLISSIKAEVSAADEWEMPSFRDVARHFLDRSLYSIGLCTQLALSSSSSIFLSTEKHGERKGRRSRAMLFHQATIQTLLDFLCLSNLYYLLCVIRAAMYTSLFPTSSVFTSPVWSDHIKLMCLLSSPLLKADLVLRNCVSYICIYRLREYLAQFWYHI